MRGMFALVDCTGNRSIARVTVQALGRQKGTVSRLEDMMWYGPDFASPSLEEGY